MTPIFTTPEKKKELLTLCMARDSWGHTLVALEHLRRLGVGPSDELYDVQVTAAAVLYMRPFERSHGLNRLTDYEVFNDVSGGDTLKLIHDAVDKLRNQITAHQQLSGWDRLLRGTPDAQPADRLVIRIGGGEPMSYEVGTPALDPSFLEHFMRLAAFQQGRANSALFNSAASVLPSLIEGRGEFLIETQIT